MRRRPILLLLSTTCVVLAGCSSSGSSHPSSSQSSPSSQSLPSPGTGSSSSARPGPAGSPSGSAAAGPRTVSILGSGDVLVHPALTAQAHADAGGNGYDFGPMYASIAPDIRAASLATCELETPLAPPRGPFAGWPNFSAPPQVLTALKAIGYTSCTTASNHTIDQGFAGVTRTLDELDAAGLKHTGSARSAQEAATPLIITLPDGVRVGQLAYAFGFNGQQLPAGQQWEANLTDIPTILKAAAAMKAAGADIVVLSMHWGTEYDNLATSLQRQQAQQLLASPDIDLILGDHTHVVEPAEKIDGKWVFYCMGNQISRHEDPIPDGREGIMPFVTFTETSPHHFVASRAEVIPTWMQDSPQLRLIDLPRSLADPSALTPAQLAEQQQARAAIVTYVDAYGADTQGLIVR